MWEENTQRATRKGASVLVTTESKKEIGQNGLVNRLVIQRSKISNTKQKHILYEVHRSNRITLSILVEILTVSVQFATTRLGFHE
jgi:hypothetical protein